MSSGLSPENEQFLSELIADHVYADRATALDAAVALLRKRRELWRDLNAGIEQISADTCHHYAPDEVDRFLADVKERERERFAPKGS